MNSQMENGAVAVPLSFASHALAQRASRHSDRTEKSNQIYLNELAVYAVDAYLRRLEFETDSDKLQFLEIFSVIVDYKKAQITHNFVF